MCSGFILGCVLVVAGAAAARPAAGAPPEPKAASKSFLEDPTPMVAAFKAKIPAPFLITELSISRESASLQAQDPKKKDTYDDYNYSKSRGVSEPDPVQVFTVTCKKGFSIGEAGSINLSRGVFCKEPRWVIFVDGKRKDGMVEYDPKGKFRNSKIM